MKCIVSSSYCNGPTKYMMWKHRIKMSYGCWEVCSYHIDSFIEESNNFSESFIHIEISFEEFKSLRIIES